MSEELHTNKTDEDYLVAYHDKLHAALLAAYQAINRNFLIVYGAAIIVVAFQLGLIEEVTISGVKASLNKEFLLFTGALISLVYILVNFQIVRIAALFIEIKENSNKIFKFNDSAKIISIKNIDLFTIGISGLILSLAKWQVNALYRKSPLVRLSTLFSGTWTNILLNIFVFIYETFNWILNIIIRVSLVLSLFFLPVLIFEYLLLDYISIRPDWFLGMKLPELDIALLVFGLLLLVSLVTAYCGLKLFFSMFVELIRDLIHTLREDANNAAAMALAKGLETVLNSIIKLLPRTIF